MDDFQQGFLSEPFDEVRHSVRERYARWHAFFLDLNKANVSLQHALPIARDDVRSLLGAALFARTLASTQAAVLLLEHGLLSQSKTVLRSALESLFALCAIATKPELAEPLARTHESDKRSLAEKMLRWKSSALKGALPDSSNEEKLREIVATKTPQLNLFQLAEAAGMTDWYLSMYALLSFPSHSSVTDLISHLVTDGNGIVEALKNEPELEDQDSAWAYASEIQISAASAANTIFGVGVPNLASLEDRLRSIA
jgi:hypothetical protein